MNKDLLQQLVSSDSPLAKDVKLALLNLAGALTQALESKSDDPAAKNCEEVLRDLKDILFHAPQTDVPRYSLSHDTLSIHPTQPPKTQGTFEAILENSPRVEQSASIESHSTVPQTSQDDGATPPHQPNLKLDELRQNIIANVALKPYLLEPKAQSIHLPSRSDVELWQAIQLLCLRLPERLAQSWQQEALITAQALGAMKDISSPLGHEIPSEQDDRESFPGLIGTITAPGLYFSAQATSEAFASDHWTNEVWTLSRIVSTLLKLVDLDSGHLYHALKSIDMFGVRSLQSPPERLKYTNALIDRLRRVQSAENQGDSLGLFLARLDLDEAIHSLVYLPPVDRDTSWWGKLQRQARRTLIEFTRQTPFQIRQLWGTYAEMCRWSKDDLEIDVGGVPGEISACLRVYAKTDLEQLPGRVLFRPN